MALKNADGLGAAWALQVAPALVVARMGPDALTAKHAAEVGQLMPEKPLVVPDTCVDQVRAPSAVRRMVPPSPTLEQIIAVGQLTPVRFWAVPDAPLSQPTPPVLVARVVPASPTRTQWETSAQLTPESAFPWGSGLCQIQVPVPVDTNAEAGIGPAWPSNPRARLNPIASKRFRLIVGKAFQPAIFEMGRSPVKGPAAVGYLLSQCNKR
jgi:hypothetical protein